MDWWAVLETFVGECAAGALVLYLGYRFVDSKLNLREHEERRKDAESDRATTRTGVLRAVLGELYSNIAQWETVAPILQKNEGTPFPLFDVPMWSVVAEPGVVSSLREETISTLMHAYNRMGSANEQCKYLSDMEHGATGLLAHASFAGRMDDPQVEQIHGQYTEHLSDTREALLDRLGDLKPFLESSIDAVETELGIEAIPASQRLFLGVRSPADRFPLGQPRKIVKLQDGDPSE